MELQRETWGQSFTDAVPASILLVAQKVGGVAAGAFSADDRLLGFVFGITGIENGEVVHWSDMLAVRPEAQNLGLGRRLKEFQRAEVAKAGGRLIYWTYDPLVARNAHLNFNVFGVRAVRYVRDMYGDDTGSDLHRGIGTDRLIVAWPVDEKALAERQRETARARDSDAYSAAPVLASPDRHDDVAALAALDQRRRVRIAAPLDIGALQSRDTQAAKRWRSATRAAFEMALGRGYIVEGFALHDDCGFYLLTPGQPTT